jgi:diaminohydroxyphosphoribosylaminopyrimidine deaminase/5-amino-6-(5-phosphoribosylamino)uracil reductase
MQAALASPPAPRRLIEEVAQASLPSAYTRDGLVMRAFRSLADGVEHLALVRGGPEPGALVRVHSECLTGDALGSLRCDCGEQLRTAMRLVGESRSGALIYVRGHEGRGIGLASKVAAYALQEQGLDTAEANAALGFATDARDYRVAAEIIQALGLSDIRLLTNNPLKGLALERYGVRVREDVPLVMAANAHNAGYLATKRDRMGHRLPAGERRCTTPPGVPAPVLAAAFQLALDEARAYVGATAPNPPVGCVLLDADGEVLAKAAHARAGQPHAEAAAIQACRAAGLVERIHTALVTLEPCSHTGRTPPCTEALLSTPVRQVWIGALDPHPRAPEAGVARLAEAGVATAMIAALDHPRAADLARAAQRLIAPFAKLSRTGRPWVVIKTALDARGGMIPPPGAKTFTSPRSLVHAHQMRRDCEAIITGSGAVLADDPAFTVRHVADHPGRRRRLAILDRRGRTPRAYLDAAGARGLDASVHTDIAALLDDLGAAGVLSALVEAGPTLRQAFLDADLWDEEVVFRCSPTPGEPDQVEIRRRAERTSAA